TRSKRDWSSDVCSSDLYDVNTLDGSEGLDADAITTDGEDLTADAPETWKPADEDESHDERLRAERPDVGESDGPTHPVDPAGPDDEPRDQIDQLDPEGETRVLGED